MNLLFSYLFCVVVCVLFVDASSSSSSSDDSAEELFQDFVDSIDGEVLIRALNDTEYQSARSELSFFPYRSALKPKLIVQCASKDDVLKTVEYALLTNTEFVVRAGGHSLAGYSTCDGMCIVIDLENLKNMALTEIPFENGDATVRVEPGVRLNELAYFLEVDGPSTITNRKYWLPLGLNNMGIGGHIHGGGWGYGVRKHGLGMSQ